MLDSPVVEVVIGLTFVFLVLSLCATALVEGLTEWRQWKGRLLHSKLRALLGARLVQLFYADRRIRDLASGAPYSPSWLTRTIGRVPGLRQLQRRWFEWGRFSPISLDEARTVSRAIGANRLPSHIPERVFADVIVDWLQGIELPQQLHPEFAAEDAIPTPLAVLWQGLSIRADGSQDALNAELQQWYAQSMDRTTGEFKRRIRVALYVVGMGLVLATNADTIKVATSLYRDPLVRTQTVAMAERAVDSCPSGPQGCAALKAYVNDTLEKPGAMGLRGWADGEAANLWGTWNLAWAAIGWSLTVLAIGMGADFWFGALKRVLTLKTAGVEAGQRVELEARGATPGSESPAPRSVVAREPLDLEAPAVAHLRGFQPLRFAESNIHAFWLAHLASLAYSEVTALRGSSLLRHHRLEVSALHAGGTQAIVFTGHDACIVAFRGTEATLEDWLTDADARQQKSPWGTADGLIGIHKGFHAALDLIWPDLLTYVTRTGLPVWFTGHSLGGALAMLAAYRLEAIEKAGIRVAGVYTFGQPRVGNNAWAQSVPAELEQRVFRYVNDRDIVPLVPPPRPIEYSHVGHARFFDASGRLHHNRTLWERIAEQLTPAISAIAAGQEDWAEVARAHARERVDDHGMARYIECLERLDAVRALWKSG